jgi:hypothetical protein
MSQVVGASVGAGDTVIGFGGSRRLALTALGALLTTGIALFAGWGLLAPRGSTVASRSVGVTHAAGTSWGEVPPLAQLAISRGLGADEHAYWAQPSAAGALARNPTQGLQAGFRRSGVTVSNSGGQLALSLQGIAAGHAGLAVQPVSPISTRNRVSYPRGPVSEWYANGPLGLEQGFQVARPLGHADTLTLTLGLGGSLRARMQADGRGISLIAPDGKIAMRYGRLSASDAAGRALPVSLALRGDRVVIHVTTAGARYPVTVDPLVEEGQLSASNSTPEGGMGSSVAIDGSTVIVGEPSAVVSGSTSANGAPQGAVYVYTEPPAGWANATQTAELIASDGGANDQYRDDDGLGSAIAISGDTIVASAPSATAGGASGVLFAGKIYVFIKPSGGWVNSTENAQLSASDASDPDYLGSSVATDGQTVVAGEPDNNGEGDGGPGALYVFSEPAGGWKSELQTAKLTAPSTSALGATVAVTGSTIVAGAPYTTVNSKEGAGALYEYTEPTSGGWQSTSSPTATLTSGGPADESLGTSVALEGSTLVAGAANNFDPGGAPSSAYVFTEPQTGWETTQTPVARLTPSDPSSAEHFGGSVGISGPTIAVGAEFAPPAVEHSDEGATYIYSEPAGGWASTSAQNAKLAAPEANFEQGKSVGVAGSSIVEGAPYATVRGHAYQGAAYIFGSSAPGEETPGAKEETPGSKEPAKETFAKPAENTKLTYVSTAPPVERETFIGFPLNVKPGEPIACIGNVCTYAAIKCNKAKEPCIGSATYEEIAGALASEARAKVKKKSKKPAVYGNASFSIPAGQTGKITIKLTAAGRKLLKGKKKARGRLTITVTQPGGKPTRSSSIVTIQLASKKKHSKG